MKLSHTALFLAAAVVLLATGLPTSPKEVLESVVKADTIVPEEEAAAVEITQKAQAHNNHKDAAPKLGGLQISWPDQNCYQNCYGGLNQPCYFDEDGHAGCSFAPGASPGGGNFGNFEANCLYGVQGWPDGPADLQYVTRCNARPGGHTNRGSCKCVEKVITTAQCKFAYPCFKDMHKFDKSIYKSGFNGAICALDTTDTSYPCTSSSSSVWSFNTPTLNEIKGLESGRIHGRILNLGSSEWWTLVKGRKTTKFD